MKKISLGLVFGYAFVALVFVVVLTWFLNIFVPKVEGFNNPDQVPSKEKVVMDWSSNYARPYVTSEMDQPDFEGNFEGGMDTTILNKYEGGIGATKDAMNVALRQYPFDWSQAPPASKVFQEQNAIQLDKENLIRNAERVPESYMAETELNAAKLLPPQQSTVHSTNKEPFVDIDAGDKVLKEYRPRDPKTVGKYDKEDSFDFIYQYYDKKGLIPEISEDGDGVYKITGYQEKKPKILYEDEAEANTTRSPFVPQGTTTEFEPTIQYAEKPWRASSKMGMDPVKTGVSKEEKSTSLDRIFGPGLQWQQWG